MVQQKHSAGANVGERLANELAFVVNVAVPQRYLLAGEADNAFDEDSAKEAKDDNLPASRTAEEIRRFIHQDPVPAHFAHFAKLKLIGTAVRAAGFRIKREPASAGPIARNSADYNRDAAAGTDRTTMMAPQSRRHAAG